jgi:hypothetical protein
MFQCKHCTQEYEDSSLVKGYKTRCKSCDKSIRGEWAKKDRLLNPTKYRDQMRLYRESNPELKAIERQRSNDYNARHREERLAYQRDRQIERKAYIDSFKNKPCMDCGKEFPNYCMDFDHVRGKKNDNLSTMKSNRTFKRILEEINKCELVCANCHRIRTHNRQQES